MKNIFSILLMTIIIALSGCTGASETNSEYPTITLQGDRDITLKVGQLIKEPGYRATDIKDGDLTSRVKVESNLDYYREGTYYVKYSVQDSDGYTATESRTVTVTKDGANSGVYAGDYQYGDVGSVYYDFATYNYNYLVREEGKTIAQEVHEYDANGERVVDVVFEKNKNDGSIYEYNNNQIENRDYIGIDKIQSVDASSNITTFLRNLRTNEIFVDKTMNGVRISCKMVEHLGSINTQTVTNSNILNFDYIDVLHAECSSSSGLTFDTYFANGWGEVLTIIRENNQVIEYSVLDKNSVQEVN
jgi:hypothetical protein